MFLYTSATPYTQYTLYKQYTIEENNMEGVRKLNLMSIGKKKGQKCRKYCPKHTLST